MSDANTDDEVPFEFSKRKWPRPWMGPFLDNLAALPVISYAAEAVKIDRRHIYRVRDTNPAFAEALEEARLRGVELLENHIHRWAVAGLKRVETTTVYDETGKIVSRRTVEGIDVNPTLAMFVLKRHKPEYRERLAVQHEGEMRVKIDGDRLDREINALLAGLAANDLPAVTAE